MEARHASREAKERPLWTPREAKEASFHRERQVFFLSRSLKSLRGPCDLLGPLGPLLKSSSPKRPLFGPTRKPKRGLFPQREASLDPSGGHAHIYGAPLATEALWLFWSQNRLFWSQNRLFWSQKRGPWGTKLLFYAFYSLF